MDGSILFFLIIWLLFALWGYNAGSKRRIGSGMGLVLGLILGFIGVIIVLVSPKLDDQQARSSEPVSDQLKKYKDLLDSGVITQTEFDNQKKKLLN